MSLPMTMTRHELQPLTTEKRMEYLEELAKTVTDRNRLKEHNAEIQKKAKEIIDSRDARIRELSEALATGGEMIPRQCLIEYDLQRNATVIKDSKTKAVVEERAMTAEERTKLIDERDDVQSKKNHGRTKFIRRR